MFVHYIYFTYFIQINGKKTVVWDDVDQVTENKVNQITIVFSNNLNYLAGLQF